jgi:hypothetical protein
LAYHIVNNDVVEISTDFVESIFNEYLPKQSIVINNTSDIEYLYQSQIKFHYVFFNSCTNPVNVEQQIKDIDIKYNFYVLTGLYKYHTHLIPDDRIKYFPFWAVWMSCQNYQFSSDLKKYKISCLNGIPREHRKLVYLKLQEKDYFSDMIFTFGHRPGLHQNFDKWSLTDQEHAAFKRLPQHVEFLPSDRDGIDVTVDHPAFQETYVNLVTETTVRADTPMLSEKTFKPIATGQLFVLIASPGAIQFLRDIGFDTFDDIIDHSYDQILDIRTRIEQTLVQIDRLAYMDLASICDTIKLRLIKNSEYLRSSAFRDQFILNFG